MWNSGHVEDAVTESGTGKVVVGPQNLDGITTSSSFAKQTETFKSDLTTRVIDITNTADISQTFNMIVGANDFSGFAWDFSFAGRYLASLGAYDLQGSFFTNSFDSLNGLSTTVTGDDFSDFDTGLMTGPNAGSFSGSAINWTVQGDYGVAERLSLFLSPGASVAIRGISIEDQAVTEPPAIPEPTTWAMLILGFGMMALLRRVTKKQSQICLDSVTHT
jgi:hypothetical protein